ncbi:MAG TPA: ABC transporter permease [Thermoanaerobaculia bacterium]|nr:ABC transporter permease [Thermoanaerobaculia bacterium]
MDALLAVARRTWTITWRRPVLLAFSLGQPLVWMLFFGFLFERFPLAGARYLDFLAPGVSVMTVLFGASQSGIGWIRDLNTGFLQRMLGTPAPPSAILGGKIVADVARLLLQAAAVLLLALLLGARLRPAPAALLAALACVILFAVAFSCLSAAFAFQVRVQEAMGTFVHLVNMPLLFTSTALVPRGQMPGWLAEVSRFNPLTLTVDAWRGALLSGAMPPLRSVLLLSALAAVLFLFALNRMTRQGGFR